MADWPGYLISSLGNVRSFRSTSGGTAPTSHPLKPFVGNQAGHLYVKLRLPGTSRTASVHGMVAAAFLGPRPAGMEIRHLDGDEQNNAVTNLAYGTRSENTKDRVRHGTHHEANKTHCPQGHPYDDENTYVSPSGHSRECRTCKYARLRAAAAARRAERTVPPRRIVPLLTLWRLAVTDDEDQAREIEQQAFMEGAGDFEVAEAWKARSERMAAEVTVVYGKPVGLTAATNGVTR